MSIEALLSILKRFWGWLMSLDWKNPRIVLTTAIFVLLPFVAKQIMIMGMILGAIMAVETLWLLEKCPDNIKQMVHKHPLIADAILTTFGTITLGGIFGTGVTLAIGASFCAIILSVSMACIDTRIDNEQQHVSATV